MTIETTIEIENNAGEIVILEIVAEYEPFQAAATGAYGMPTECDSEEICDITTVNGQDDEKLFNSEFDVAYNYKEWYNKLTAAVREAFDDEFRAVSC
jgi:hypothetical protein